MTTQKSPWPPRMWIISEMIPESFDPVSGTIAGEGNRIEYISLQEHEAIVAKLQREKEIAVLEAKADAWELAYCEAVTESDYFKAISRCHMEKYHAQAEALKKEMGGGRE